ncbi:MAG TPA: phage tail sheath C-terminal domain-containing protein [Anaerolineales bacterium]|nr:phage tail sheath C-terminal domain-containing protein [Anaerolineales bacterium]
MPPEIENPGVYIEELPSGVRPIRGVPTGVAGFVGETTRGVRSQAVAVESVSGFERIFGRGGPVHTALFLFFENGGREAVVVRRRDASLKAFFQALSALDAVEDVNLLCLPGSAPLDPDRLVKAVDYCEGGRVFLLLDPDPGWSSASDVLAGVGGLANAGPNTALYFPALAGSGGAGIPPCGAVAGVIARTDRERGVWKAPAGVEAVLNSVRGTGIPVDDATIQQLTPLGVNLLREDPTAGTLVWGARTLAGNGSEWKYIPVRRTALFIEESIERGTKWVVFEPNDEPLWLQLRSSVEAFLFDLFRQGAFQGAKPEQAFFVRCDRSTMTRNDIDAGRVNLLVGFAPLRPAEFIVLRFELQARTP